MDVAAAPLPAAKSSHKKAQRNEPQFAAREECYRVLGVDLTQVPGFATPTVLVLLCELGPEFAEKFTTAKHFGSWLGLCPDNRITGGKIYSVRTRGREEPRGRGVAPGGPKPVAGPELLW